MYNEIKEFITNFNKAMEFHDIATLRSLMDNNAYFVHITGYEQPCEEWFSQIGTSYFDYKKVDSDNITFVINEDYIYVKYNWTVVSIGQWNFKNEITLKNVKGNLIWIGKNKLSYR